MSTQNNSEPAFTHTAMQPAMYDSTSITATANTIGLRVFTLVHVALIIYSYYSENIYLAVSKGLLSLALGQFVSYNITRMAIIFVNDS